MPTEPGKDKVSTHVRLTAELRRGAIELLRRDETLTEFIEVAMAREIERRKAEPETGTSGPAKLLRGKRPKK